MSLPPSSNHSTVQVIAQNDINAFPFDRKPTAPDSPSDGASAYPSPLHTADDTDFSSNTSSLAPSVTTSNTDRTLGNGLNPLHQLPTSDARDPPVAEPAPQSAVVEVEVNGHDHAMEGWKEAGAAGSGVGVPSLEQEENAGGPPMPPAGVEAAARKLPLGASAEESGNGGVGESPAERRDATAHTNGIEVSQWVNGDDADGVELGGEHGALNGHGGDTEMGMPGNDHDLLGPGSPTQDAPEPSDSVTVPITSGGHLPMSMDVDQPLTPADDALPTPASMASQSPVPASVPAPTISSGLVGDRAPAPPAMTIEPHQALLTVSPNSLKRPSPGAEIDTVVLQSGAGPQPVGQQGGVGVSYLATGGLGLSAAGSDAVEPPSKKMKTENDIAMSGVITASPASVPAPPLPTPNTAVAAPLPPTPRGTYFPSRQASLAPHLQGRMTANRHRFCLSSVRSLKKHRDAHPFNQPVDVELLKIPDYFKVITKPMDLGTVEKRLLLAKGDGKGGLVTVQPPPGSENLRPYEWVEEWIDDVRQVWVNCYTYNGPWETVAISKMARGLEEVFDKQLGKMPPEQVTPAVGATAISPGESPALKKAPMPRRPSLPASSVKADRPKREVAPPIKLQAYSEPSTTNGKRRKSSIGAKASKKAAEEVKFAEKVIKELHKKQHEGITWPFLQPVDFVALGIPEYPKIIKKPIDLGTIRSKLDNGHYRAGNEFENDMRLLLRNCFTFNPPDTPVAILGRKLEALFNEKWEERPRTRDVSPDDEEEEEEDDEEEDEEPADSRSDQIALLQKQLMTLTSTIQQLQETKPPAKKKKKPKAEPVEPPPKPVKPKAAPKATNGASAGPSAPKPAKTSPSAPKKAPSKPKKPKKAAESGEREVSFEMKAELAETIPNIDGPKLEKAVEIIKKGMPHLLADDDKEIELDIDLLDQRTLWKLYDFVVGKKDAAPAKPKKSHVQLGPRKPNRAATGGVARKQLDEDAQAAQIAQLESQLAMFNDPTAQAGGQSAAQAGMGQGGDMASSSSESEDGSDSDSDSDEE